MADDFYPFVDSGDPAPDNRHITGISDGQHADMANAAPSAQTDQAKTPQDEAAAAAEPSGESTVFATRIAIYDDMLSTPRVIVVQPKDPRSYLEEITNTVYRCMKEQGGSLSLMVIRELVENFIHAHFTEPIVSILDGGNTIRFADQGPGINDKERAFEFGVTSANRSMKRYIRGTGAGLPSYLGIEGEGLNGVSVASELLTRVNLMKAYQFPEYETPVYAGKKCVVVGGGNVAMDAARCAKRLGAEVHIIYRRSEAELPARAEEVHHAKEEGIIFDLLTNPIAIEGDEQNHVKAITCIRMELGEPDESGRRRPVPVKGSEFETEVDAVIMALGTQANQMSYDGTPGLEKTRKGCVAADEKGCTSCPGIFAGGDAATGAATVILAMGAGKHAAKSIDAYIKQKG